MATKIANIAAKIAMPASRSMNAVVVSSGLMDKTVKVRVGTRQWNAHLNKNFHRTSDILCHDPANSLRTGDIVSIKPGWRTSSTVHHVVSEILAPFGSGIEERPRVPTEEERIAEREWKRAAKEERRRARAAGGEGVKSVEDVEGVEATATSS